MALVGVLAPDIADAAEECVRTLRIKVEGERDYPRDRPGRPPVDVDAWLRTIDRMQIALDAHHGRGSFAAAAPAPHPPASTLSSATWTSSSSATPPTAEPSPDGREMAAEAVGTVPAELAARALASVREVHALHEQARSVVARALAVRSDLEAHFGEPGIDDVDAYGWAWFETMGCSVVVDLLCSLAGMANEVTESLHNSPMPEAEARSAVAEVLHGTHTPDGSPGPGGEAPDTHSADAGSPRDLAADVDALRARLDGMATEVRTRRLVVVDQAGVPRVETTVNDTMSRLTVASPPADLGEQWAVVTIDATEDEMGDALSAAAVTLHAHGTPGAALVAEEVGGNRATAGHIDRPVVRGEVMVHDSPDDLTGWVLDGDGVHRKTWGTDETLVDVVVADLTGHLGASVVPVSSLGGQHTFVVDGSVPFDGQVAALTAEILDGVTDDPVAAVRLATSAMTRARGGGMTAVAVCTPDDVSALRDLVAGWVADLHAITDDATIDRLAAQAERRAQRMVQPAGLDEVAAESATMFATAVATVLDLLDVIDRVIARVAGHVDLPDERPEVGVATVPRLAEVVDVRLDVAVGHWARCRSRVAA